MRKNLTAVEDMAELDRILADSAERPLLLFKHSLTCGTSAEALDELLSHVDAGGHDVHYAMVTVQRHRDVSQEVARRLGIRHETPQALLVRDGRVVWNASHFRLTAASVDRAIAELTGT